jgi:hypothetical protein
MVKIMKLPLFMVFVYAHIHFRIWTRIRIRNPRVTDPVSDPAKVPDPCGSGSTTLDSCFQNHFFPFHWHHPVSITSNKADNAEGSA